MDRLQGTSRCHQFQEGFDGGKSLVEIFHKIYHTARGTRTQYKTVYNNHSRKSSSFLTLHLAKIYDTRSQAEARLCAGHLPGSPLTQKHADLPNRTTEAPVCHMARGNWQRGHTRMRTRHDLSKRLPVNAADWRLLSNPRGTTRDAVNCSRAKDWTPVGAYPVQTGVPRAESQSLP